MSTREILSPTLTVSTGQQLAIDPVNRNALTVLTPRVVVAAIQTITIKPAY